MQLEFSGFAELVCETERGLYCPAGDFYIDPGKGVERAVVTHAHADHARRGSKRYLTAAPGVELLRQRLGKQIRVEGLPYGQPLQLGGVRLSLHPAGHLLGSSQVRIERRGQVIVVSGDYKTEADPTCAPFEPLRCHTFLTEATFGHPSYNWLPQQELFQKIDTWWEKNRQRRRTTLLLAYSLGKAQRLLAGLSRRGPIFVHPAVAEFLPLYAAQGIALPEVRLAEAAAVRQERGQGLVVAPPAAARGEWREALGPCVSAFISGWTAAGAGFRAGFGFPLSDHADWGGLNRAIRESGAQRVGVTCGFKKELTAHLCQRGLCAWPMKGG